jgi:Divergent InlB B-repeat domain/WD40-like Beta Propeller Repeat
VSDLRGIARLILGSLVCTLAALLACCQQQINFPAPVIADLVPTNMPAGQPAFTIEVNGHHFTPSSVVLWNGSPRNTLFINTGELTAEIFASDIQNPGTAMIEVNTPQPGGGTTLPLIFTIEAVASPVPQITSLSPTAVATGSASFLLNVMGSNFVAQSTVTVNGNIRSTVFLSSTSIEATVLSSDVATAGTVEVAVVNPPPGGGTSAAVGLPIQNPLPSLSTLAPTSILAGSTTATLTLTGAGFVPDSAVTLNGSPRTTTFTSATQIQATLNAGDLTAAGVVQIQVTNPPDGGSGGGSSNPLTFSVNGTELIGLPLIEDLATNGTQANTGICGTNCTSGTPTLATAGPSASQTGEFVAFASTSTNLLTTPVITSSSIFLRDTCFSNVVKTGGSGSCVPKTTLASVSPNGTPANGASSEPSVDSSGTHVAFTSTSSNLVTYAVVPAGPRQVYWQTPCTGATGCNSGTDTAALVSIAPDNVTPGNGESFNPVISSDGRYVAFVSLATNLLVTPPANGFDGVTPQVFVRDTCEEVPPIALGGCVPTTFLVSVSPDGTTAGDGPSSHPAIASEGLFVSYVSSATNLVTGSNPNATDQVFEQSTCVTTIGVAGNSCAPVTSLISTPDGVTPANAASVEPSISQDGRFVAFASTATNLLPGVGPIQEIYVRDTCTGAAVTTPPCAPTTLLVSTPDGTTPANGLSENPSVSQCGSTITTTGCTNGQPVAFASFASNLNGITSNGIENIFVRNACLNPVLILDTTTPSCVTFTLLASKPAGSAPPPADGMSVTPSISGDGNTVSFISFANNLVANDSSTFEDIFLASATLTFSLTVTVQGTGTTGSGTVADGTGQVSCVETAGVNGLPAVQSGTCTARYLSGTSVTLTATPASGSTFVSWAGSVLNTNCVATPTTDTVGTAGTCTFSALQNNTVTATFK